MASIPKEPTPKETPHTQPAPKETAGEFKKLPSVERLASTSQALDHFARVQIAQQVIGRHRELIQTTGSCAGFDTIVDEFAKLCRLPKPLRRVINATGIVLHTNLGRAPLGRDVTRSLEQISGYCSLEFEEGRRTDRGRAVEKALQLFTNAESAVVVNNNAAALVLMLHTMALGKEVIVSRGELVQIGGGFRIPEILEAGGAQLVEVGTTNITETEDYARAIGPQTAMILKINPSNFVISGHCKQPDLNDLSKLSVGRGVNLVFDEGSGAIDGVWGIRRAVQLCDLVCFSGDKLLGGPQAGIIVGKGSLVKRLKASPIYRALRPGKLDLYCLEMVMGTRLRGLSTPTDELLELSAPAIEKKAREISQSLPFPSRVIAGVSQVGGGSKPGVELDTFLVEIVGDEERLAQALLAEEPSIVVRKDKGVILLDLRTVFDDEMIALTRSLKKVVPCSS